MNDSHGRSLSLTHINNFSSLPIIPSDESIHHVLKETYFSAPDFSRLESPPSYETTLGLKHDHSRPLTHGSRSSSLGDCQAACDRVDEEASLSVSRSFNNRRSSLLSSHSLSNSQGELNSLSNSQGDLSNEQIFTEPPVCGPIYKVPPTTHRPCLHSTSSETVTELTRGEGESPTKLVAPGVGGASGRLEAILSVRLDSHTTHNGGYSVHGLQDVATPTSECVCVCVCVHTHNVCYLVLVLFSVNLFPYKGLVDLLYTYILYIWHIHFVIEYPYN